MTPQAPRPAVLTGLGDSTERLVPLSISSMRVLAADEPAAVASLAAAPRPEEAPARDGPALALRPETDLVEVLRAFGVHGHRHPNLDVTLEGITGDWVTPADLVCLQVLAPYLPDHATMVLGTVHREPRYGVTVRGHQLDLTDDVEVEVEVEYRF